MKWGLPLLAAAALMSCSPPKYARYKSPAGDFDCDVPWGWSVFEERQGGDFGRLLFVGPFDPDFYRGRPSLDVFWYARGKAYASAEEFIARTLTEVYGPNAGLLEGRGPVEVSRRRAEHFVVLSPAPASPNARYGVSEDARGRLANVRQHAYVVLPLDSGFYVLVYPATRQGYSKYLDRFNRLVNTFRVLKEGPDGPGA